MFLYAIFVIALVAIILYLRWCSIVLLVPELFSLITDALIDAFYDMDMFEYKITFVVITFMVSYALNKSYMFAFMTALVMLGLELGEYQYAV